MGRFDVSSGEEFASFDKQEVKASTAYVTRRLVKKLEVLIWKTFKRENEGMILDGFR